MTNVSRLKITVMGIFTEIYSFRLGTGHKCRDTNVVWNTKCCTGQSFIQFLQGTD